MVRFFFFFLEQIYLHVRLVINTQWLGPIYLTPANNDLEGITEGQNEKFMSDCTEKIKKSHMNNHF